MKGLSERMIQWPLELIFWLGCIVAVLTINPEIEAFSICPLHQLGLEWCPGCGLGKAMNLLARGEVQASWQFHPAASLAYGVIFHRIWVLVKQLKHRTHYGKCIEASS
ncbi:MAG: hypothetical protein RL407_2285 [Bacteroidota bacterium]|jgi:hypothetical protein